MDLDCHSPGLFVAPAPGDFCVAVDEFDWAVPKVSILSYAHLFIRLVLCTNGFESSERTNVWMLRVAKAAQITWHTKGGQRGSDST